MSVDYTGSARLYRCSIMIGYLLNRVDTSLRLRKSPRAL